MKPVPTVRVVALVAALVALGAGGPGMAGDHCRNCGRTAGGQTTPYGDTGCGPRYWGAWHDEPRTPDPCDACNRWRDCHGGREMPEAVAPWQLPPGRGFVAPAALGYRPVRCTSCGPSFRGW